jgi:hypothetical protein
MANQRQYESQVWNYLYIVLGEGKDHYKNEILNSFIGPGPGTHVQSVRFDDAYDKVRSQIKRFAGEEEDLL